MAPKRGLGKGLGALISDSYDDEVITKEKAPASKAGSTKEASAGNVATLSITDLHHGKYQPRHRFNEEALKELAESIKKNGVMQPIIVRESSKYKGKYEIIAGERRWRASKMASLEQVPVIIRTLSDKEALEFALVENIQRQDLSPLEEALGYLRLTEEFKYSQEELASVVGKSRSHVANMMRLLALPEDVKTLVDSGKLSMGHARALLTSKDPSALAQQIIKEGLSVRAAEGFAKGAGTHKAPKEKGATSAPSRARTATHNGTKDPDILALEESLSDDLGIQVSINDRGQSGEVVLGYESLVQLDEILQRLSKRI